MTFHVIILPQAHRDIDRNADWWADHHSVDQAVRWADTVYDQIGTLANFPESNGLSAECDSFPYQTRDKLVGLGARPGYRAVFTIKDDTVYVLTVRRAAQGTLRPDQVDSLPEI